jgi:hypothetical protein
MLSYAASPLLLKISEKQPFIPQINARQTRAFRPFRKRALRNDCINPA